MLHHTKGKRIQKAFAEYQTAEKTTLAECYKKPSEGKQRLYEHYRSIFNRYNGINPRIIRAGRITYSYCFKGTINNKSAFFYLTMDNDFYAYLAEINTNKELTQ